MRCPDREMSSGISTATKRLLGLLLLLLVFSPGVSGAKLLKGSVQESRLRLNRDLEEHMPNNSIPVAPMRLMRPTLDGQGQKGLIDVNAFSPLIGKVQQEGAHLGLVQLGEFGSIPNSKFDLGADRGSRQLVLAWERWHHQLSKEIYRRWQDVASIPGEATLRITVNRNRAIRADFARSSGNPQFDMILLSVIHSLNGDPGLTFPTGSQRNAVSLEADYIASTNINPGFTWVKNDYEKIREHY